MTKFQLTPRDAFFCQAIRHRDNLDCATLVKLYHQLGDEQIFQDCVKNGIDSIAGDALSLCPSIETLPDHWQAARFKVGERVSRYLTELDRVATALRAAKIPLVALKNSGIVRGIYSYPEASPMGDLDLLVRRSDFRTAHSIILKSGYHLKFRSPLEEEDIEKAEKSGGAEYFRELDAGEPMWLELQWRPIAGRWIRQEREPNATELMARSVEIANSDVRLLSPEDNLLQVALHTAKHSYVRAPGFRLHTDVDRLVHELDIDWNLFLSRVEEARLCTAVYFSLQMAKELLQTPIPDWVLIRLSPAAWKRGIIRWWLMSVGLFDPMTPKWSRLGYVLFVILLYDNLVELVQSIFPASDWMKKRYGFSSSWWLPVYHTRRIFDLLTKRVNT
jgi:hypothetical protein